jgi:hypothetical protein
MPVQHVLINRFLVSALLCLFVFFPCGVANGAPSSDIDWQTIETKHAIVHYQSQDDLNEFNKKIRYRGRHSRLSGFFSSSGSNDLEETVSKKVDALFERAQQILDMRKKIDKVTINIYHNKEELHKTYERIYRKPCRIRAWYEYRFHTIFICLDDIYDGMLAHEMAHGIIDHYLKVRPPSATAEILARYVDSHLRE